MKLISDKMCKALDDLTAFCFLGNRIFDSSSFKYGTSISFIGRLNNRLLFW